MRAAPHSRKVWVAIGIIAAAAVICCALRLYPGRWPPRPAFVAAQAVRALPPLQRRAGRAQAEKDWAKGTPLLYVQSLEGYPDLEEHYGTGSGVHRTAWDPETGARLVELASKGPGRAYEEGYSSAITRKVAKYGPAHRGVGVSYRAKHCMWASALAGALWASSCARRLEAVGFATATATC